ncbi:hypothetical protein [Desulfohalobium retbaense]|uniref:Uncharacterized protein n=1 Tax=Desulfohalobium retbaense (strain ATCC 49708 / DSM 5692 / JCM 16813 / HR100) TaxID=485915 RepID=C8X4Q3_DESRD|nr:hypothetical protein [Desulfohalobium retbaense]ACV69276.1 hypothetical protein Dret_1992 [Desulfohalobium retbaense DSM 5692]
MEKLGQIGLTKKSLALLLASALILLFIFLFFILPTKSEISALQSKSKKLASKIEFHQSLQPLYSNLNKKTKTTNRRINTFKEFKKGFTPLHIENAAAKIETMAKAVGLTDALFFPVPMSLSGKKKKLLVEGSFRGNPLDFRIFFLKLIAWENFSNLEALEVFGRQSRTEYGIQFWLTIGSDNQKNNTSNHFN